MMHSPPPSIINTPIINSTHPMTMASCPPPPRLGGALEGDPRDVVVDILGHQQSSSQLPTFPSLFVSSSSFISDDDNNRTTPNNTPDMSPEQQQSSRRRPIIINLQQRKRSYTECQSSSSFTTKLGDAPSSVTTSYNRSLQHGHLKALVDTVDTSSKTMASLSLTPKYEEEDEEVVDHHIAVQKMGTVQVHMMKRLHRASLCRDYSRTTLSDQEINAPTVRSASFPRAA